MIEWISNWAGGIIIAVIIGTIIEMILPEGSSKKYIKVVVGVYILFTIISPVMTKLTGKSFAVSEILEIDKYIDEVRERENTQNVLKNENLTSIRDIYVGNLKADIQNKLKARGYLVKNIELEIENDNKYTLNKMYLSISKEEYVDEEEEHINEVIETINEINIHVSNNSIQSNTIVKEKTKSNLSNSEQQKIKEYLSNVYEVNEKNIMID